MCTVYVRVPLSLPLASHQACLCTVLEHHSFCSPIHAPLATQSSGQALQVDLAPTEPGSRVSNRFHIPAAEVAAMLKEQGCSRAELLQSLVTPSSHLARPPISEYHVGAVGITPAGDLHLRVSLLSISRSRAKKATVCGPRPTSVLVSLLP